MNKKFFVSALALLTLISINALKASAQSCPNQVAFGERQSIAADNSAQSQIEVTYFTTADPNVFISEKAGLRRSSRSVKLLSNQFVAQLARLQSEGVASIRKSQSATSFLGELAELNLERNPASSDARVVNASFASNDPNYLRGLDRETQVSVSQNAALDGEYFRVSLISWFVNAGQKSVDNDASMLLKPGQTVIFKLVSNDEVARSGAARSYMAVTLRAVNKTGMASLNHSRTAIARR